MHPFVGEISAALHHAAKTSSSWVLQADRRAVVACIIRQAPPAAHSPSHSTPSPTPPSPPHPLHQFEVLFILRASDPNGGRWSGQVAFPGGHAEGGESDVEVRALLWKKLYLALSLSLFHTCTFTRTYTHRELDLPACTHTHSRTLARTKIPYMLKRPHTIITSVHDTIDDST